MRCNGLYWRLLFFTSKHSSFLPFFLPPIKNVSQSDMWMDKFTTILKYEGLKPYLWKNISTTHSTWNLWCLIDWIKHDADLAPNLIDSSEHGCHTIVPERFVSPFLAPSSSCLMSRSSLLLLMAMTIMRRNTTRARCSWPLPYGNCRLCIGCRSSTPPLRQLLLV